MTIMLGSCEKEELEKNIKHPSQQDLELIDYKDLPSPLLLNLQNSNYGFESKRARPFGEIDENFKIKRIVDKNGIPSYTFSLKKIDNKTSVQNSSGYYFDNLVVQAGKEYKTIILRYQPTLAWQTGNRDLRNFSGNILFFSVEGEKRNTLILENGVPIDSPPNNEKLVCHYTFSHAVIITSGDGSSSFTVYYYTERCSASEIHEPGGGGGCKSQNCGPTEPESIPTIPTEGDPDWDFGAGGGGSSPTAEVVAKTINELVGKANCIYNILGGTAVGNLNIMHHTFLTFSDMQYNPADIIYRQEAGLVNDDGIQLNGRTRKVGDDYVVTLNSDRIINRSSIEVAKTILHESVHAILKRRYNVHPEGFIDSFKKYIESETGSNNITHAIMRDHYIEPMIKNLKQFDNFRENDTFYRNLAWEGLHQFLTDAEKDNIISTLDEARQRDGAMNCGEY